MRRRLRAVSAVASIVLVLSACGLGDFGKIVIDEGIAPAPLSQGGQANRPAKETGTCDSRKDDERLEKILREVSGQLNGAPFKIHSAREIRDQTAELEEMLPSLQAAFEDLATVAASHFPSPAASAKPNMFNLEISSSVPQCAPNRFYV